MKIIASAVQVCPAAQELVMLKMLLWKVAVSFYKPNWILGNKFQSWWYFKIDSLIEYLVSDLEKSIATAEREARHEG